MLKFSVIICTFNRCEILKGTIESLMKQECDWASVIEIIIVDNNSTDDTEYLIKSFVGSFKTKLIYLKETKQGKSYALNLAIKASQGDVLVFTDDDVIFDPHWLNEIIQFFMTNKVDVLGGRVLPLFTSRTSQWIKQNQYHLRGIIGCYDHGEGIIDYDSGEISEFIGANVAYRKSVFKTTGLYNNDLGVGRGTLCEDTEMFKRAMQANKKMFYNGKALVWHKNPKSLNLRYIAKWNYEYGKSMTMLYPIDDKKNLSSIGGIPRYLFKTILIKLIELLLTMFQPKLFLKYWCSFYFNLGMFAGYAKYKCLNTSQKD